MNLELTDEQTGALTRELSRVIDNDRYPLSPRIVTLKEILGKLRPEPERPAPLSPRRHYEPPSRGGMGGGTVEVAADQMGVLKDSYEILLGAWRAIRERGAGSICRSVARGVSAWTVEEWLVPEFALERYASPALLEARDKAGQTILNIEYKRHPAPRDEELRQGQELEDAYRGYRAFERSIENDVRERLLHGELLARGFREPFIARHEWHVLELKPPNRAEGGGIGYVGDWETRH